MKVSRIILMTLVLLNIQTMLTELPVFRDRSLQPEQSKPRNLLISFSWTANEKRYVQRERMKEIMRNNLKGLMERYQFDTHLDQWNHELIEDVHRQYYKAKSNVQLAKHFLIEKMDNIYNNFVQPSRWFY